MKSPRKGAKAADKAAPKRAAKVHNLIDPDTRKLFLQNRDQWAVLNEKANSANAKRRAFEKQIKGDGFKLSQIKDSILASSPEGEAQIRAEVANRLLACAYVGSTMGEQLSLFLDDVRTPAVDTAAKEGQGDAMSNKAARPKYDPSTPQHSSYMAAYHEEQERQVLKGIKKIDAKADKKPADKPAGKKRGRPPAAKSDDAGPPKGSERTLIKKADKDAKVAAKKAMEPKPAAPKPAAGMAVTRSTVAAQKAAAKDEAESFFKPKGTPTH